MGTRCSWGFTPSICRNPLQWKMPVNLPPFSVHFLSILRSRILEMPGTSYHLLSSHILAMFASWHIAHCGVRVHIYGQAAKFHSRAHSSHSIRIKATVDKSTVYNVTHKFALFQVYLQRFLVSWLRLSCRQLCAWHFSSRTFQVFRMMLTVQCKEMWSLTCS